VVLNEFSRSWNCVHVDQIFSLMELCSWNSAHGTVLMEVCSWNYSHGTVLMEGIVRGDVAVLGYLAH